MSAVGDDGRAISVIPPFGTLQLERASPANRSAAHIDRQRLETISRLVDAGQLRPQVEVVLPLGQVGEALRRVDSRHTRGQIVLHIGK